MKEKKKRYTIFLLACFLLLYIMSKAAFACCEGVSCGPCEHCVDGVCVDECSSSQTCCGGTCCDPLDCCNGSCCSSFQSCCGTCCDPWDCCGGSCCSNTCCNGSCCGPGQNCCGGSCCSNSCCDYLTCYDPSTDKCCNDGLGNTCPKDDECCNGKCCSPDECCNVYGTCVEKCTMTGQCSYTPPETSGYVKCENFNPTDKSCEDFIEGALCNHLVTVGLNEAECADCAPNCDKTRICACAEITPFHCKTICFWDGIPPCACVCDAGEPYTSGDYYQCD